jgi:hypothetical protein
MVGSLDGRPADSQLTDAMGEVELVEHLRNDHLRRTGSCVHGVVPGPPWCSTTATRLNNACWFTSAIARQSGSSSTSDSSASPGQGWRVGRVHGRRRSSCGRPPRARGCCRTRSRSAAHGIEERLQLSGQWGSSELSMVRAGSIGSPSIGGKHDPQPIMIKISEAVGEPADLFGDQVDGFGATVGYA